jgi:hypothetical protein
MPDHRDADDYEALAAIGRPLQAHEYICVSADLSRI